MRVRQTTTRRCKLKPLNLPGDKAKGYIQRDRMVVSPSYPRGYPFVMDHGKGVFVWDVDGNQFLDFAAGIAVNSTGHSHPNVVKAIQEQAEKFIHISSDFYHTKWIELGEKISEIAPFEENAVSLMTNSGTESVEAAIKLARIHAGAGRYQVISLTGSFHGRTLATVAATGRLSSADPNLQNIPIRTPEGRRIRETFVAEEGHLLLSADYSQIELRVLAHLSGDPTLIDTFRRGEDVHDRTSREIFGPLSPIPPDEQRRISKMVNYALLYGKTAFSLAKDIGVSRKEAESFIEAYFARYPKVRGFIDDTIAKARETGHVRTLLGRLRRLPDLRAKSFPVRMEAERQAMNTPVQGSAADLIKRAMIDLHRELAERKLGSRLILQIHDELLLEVPEAEAEEARALVKDVMEGALALDVPLVADARLGRNWAEVH